MTRIDPESGRRTAAQLRIHQDGNGNTSVLDVRVLPDGSVEFSGQDLGPMTAGISPDGEYEYWRTVDARHVPDLVALIGGRPDEHVIDLLVRDWTGTRSFDLERLLNTASFPVRFFSY